MTTTHALPAKAASTSVAVPSGKEWQARLGSALAALDGWVTSRRTETGDWRPTLAVRRDLASILETMELACRPLSERDFAVVFARFMETAILLGIAKAGTSKEEVALQLGVYRDALGDLPGDLLAWSMKAVWKDWRWQSLPKPGDIYDRIREKVSRRRDMLQQARHAADLCRRRGLPVGLEAAVEEAAPVGKRQPLSPELQAMVDEAKRPKRHLSEGLRPPAGQRENSKGELLVEPRPDLVAKYARELGIMLPG